MWEIRRKYERNMKEMQWNYEGHIKGIERHYEGNMKAMPRNYEGHIKGKYLPDFFKVCYEMENNFCYEKFGALVLRPLSLPELKDCPGAFLRVIDGMHRVLVLAYLVKKEASFFRPIHCFLVQ